MADSAEMVFAAGDNWQIKDVKLLITSHSMNRSAKLCAVLSYVS